MITRDAIRKKATEQGVSEKELIMDALEKCNHEQANVAHLLGISQAAVSKAMKRLKFIRIVKWLPESEAS